MGSEHMGQTGFDCMGCRILGQGGCSGSAPIGLLRILGNGRCSGFVSVELLVGFHGFVGGVPFSLEAVVGVAVPSHEIPEAHSFCFALDACWFMLPEVLLFALGEGFLDPRMV
jgi:hypothetical protein